MANFARCAEGRRHRQIKAVGAGECGVALVSSYYLARMFQSRTNPTTTRPWSASACGPAKASYGTHINISGGGVDRGTRRTKGKRGRSSGYLASPDAQNYFANGNNEQPEVAGVKISNRGLRNMGSNFKATDAMPVRLRETIVEACSIYDRAGFR